MSTPGLRERKKIRGEAAPLSIARHTRIKCQSSLTLDQGNSRFR
ncbi:hypothetical protein Pla144_19680 [Bythopirellula polymerisocia]|uniref:Uncharacterized protein n=1 Tax=Bythopirellula polymerisocia TaxID=2528003 RepID=A0A5C6D0H5_9BACT|nr:hypothetical protein Pla144_19680 [Bythopirellula polymerisocia]